MPPNSNRKIRRMTTGISGLDEVLEGGFPSDRLYLIQGGPGVGKTTLGLQFALEGARRHEPTLFLTMTETETEIRETASSHGWNLEGVELAHIGRDYAPEAQQTMLHSSEVALPELAQAILKAVDEVQPKRLVLDSLSELRVLAQDELWYREQLQTLKHHLTNRGCTVLFLANSVENADAEVQSIASGVIELEQRVPEFGSTRRRLNVLKIRGSGYQSGFHDITLDTGGIRLCPRLVASDHREPFEPRQISSGVEELDALLGGGLDAGTSSLLAGPSGVGKSVVATQYIAAAAERGERSAVYLFDEKEQTFFERSRKMGFEFRSLVERDLLLVFQVDPGHMSPGHFSELVRNAVADRGVELVVIDSLSGYQNSMEKGHNLTLYMHELVKYLGQQAVTSLLIVSQHGLFGAEIHPSFDVSYLADNVLLFRYFEHGGEVHQALSVFKRRSGAHERTIRELKLTARGIQIGEPLTRFRGVLTGLPQYEGESSSLAGGA